jgi:hypothetical protein
MKRLIAWLNTKRAIFKVKIDIREDDIFVLCCYQNLPERRFKAWDAAVKYIKEVMIHLLLESYIDENILLRMFSGPEEPPSEILKEWLPKNLMEEYEKLRLLSDRKKFYKSKGWTYERFVQHLKSLGYEEIEYQTSNIGPLSSD